MLEPIVTFLSSVPWYWVLLVALFITALENIFPPAPCDTVLVFTGTLVGLNAVGFIPLVLIATLGSTIGFAIMFKLGEILGVRLVKSPKFTFINEESMKKPELWLKKWGYYVIVANRFLSGTRAIISFLAGMYKMRFDWTILLSAVSALFWNAILIYSGYLLGENWRQAEYYMTLYGRIILPAIAAVIITIIWIRCYLKRKRAKTTMSKIEANL
ncbi:MAG: DedA family protein [Bacteroidetes bacterium]|nr:MAG: DedA family protein [Bacteroidota bacterium]